MYNVEHCRNEDVDQTEKKKRYFTPAGMSTVKKTSRKFTSVEKVVEKLEPLEARWEGFLQN